nr:GH32 C-terminal domain-containing protein [Agrilactobacillus composti]
MLAYQAPDPKGPWTLKGELHYSDQNLGYMVECPNLIFIDQQPVLIFCPQGLSQTIASYDNIYPNMYIVGEAFDWDTLSFINPTGPQNLDGGFDVYATQAFNAPDDQAYAISWLGLPDTTYPSDAENWQGCFSLVKHLTLVAGQLRQQAVAQGLAKAAFDPKTADLQLQEKLQFDFPNFPKGQLQIKAQHSSDKLTLSFDAQTHSLTVDRGQMGQPVALDHGTIRSIQLPATALRLTLWLDHSAFELYVNDGAQVVSGRLFPRQADTYQLDTSQLAADDFEVSGTRLQTIY